MEEKRITIYDIAAEVGVSASLVSRVVSGKGSVSDKTRKKIQDVIDKYDFRPNAMARGLQKSRTRMIGFMIPHIGNEYFSNVYYEFEKHASENGFMTILYKGKNDRGTEPEPPGALHYMQRAGGEIRVHGGAYRHGKESAAGCGAFI